MAIFTIDAAPGEPMRRPLARALSCLTLAVAIAPSLGHAEDLKLADVLRRVTEDSPERAAALADVPAAEADVTTARMIPNPTVGLGLARSEPILNFWIDLRLPLFGQRGAHAEAAERGLDQTRAEAQSALWRLRHDARVAYFAVQRADDEVAIAIEVEKLTGRVAEIARQRFEAGAGARLEQDQAALLHARATQEIADRRALAAAARVELSRLLGATPDQIGRLADPMDAPAPMAMLPSLLEQSKSAHPELKALERARAAALARAESARVDRRPLPVLELGGELLDHTTCGNASNRCLGPRGALSFDLPLLNLNTGPITRAEAEARAAELRRDALARRIEAQIRTAHANLVASGARAKFFDGSYVPAALSVEAMAREGFQAGRTGILPLLEAERAVLEARVGRAEAFFAVQAARADLEEASGVPL